MRGPPGAPGSYEKPRDTARVVRRLLGYLQRRSLALLAVVILVVISSAATLGGNYLLKPLINNYILPGDFSGLARALMGLAVIYLIGVAATYAQSRIMVHVAQRTSNTLRHDLFVKMQSLPLSYFDRYPHGELMSRYTNDIDQVQLLVQTKRSF